MAFAVIALSLLLSGAKTFAFSPDFEIDRGLLQRGTSAMQEISYGSVANSKCPELIAAMPSSSEPAASPSADISCKNVEVLNLQDDDHTEGHKHKFDRLDLSIEVRKSESGTFGYVADIVSKGTSRVEKDVKVITVTPSEASHVRSLTKKMFPDFDYSKVKKIRMSNVGVAANQKNGSGTYIYELLGEDESKPLASVASLGFRLARCNQ